MNDGMPVSNDDDDYYYVLVTPVYKSSVAAEMGDRLATIDMDRKVARAAMGGGVPTGSPSNTMWPGPRPPSLPMGRNFRGGLGPHLTQNPLG